MKQYGKLIFGLTVLTVVLICFPSLVHAQGGPGGDPDALPVDGGISILAAAGVAYSVKKIKEYRKKKNEQHGEPNNEIK